MTENNPAKVSSPRSAPSAPLLAGLASASCSTALPVKADGITMTEFSSVNDGDRGTRNVSSFSVGATSVLRTGVSMGRPPQLARGPSSDVTVRQHQLEQAQQLPRRNSDEPVMLTNDDATVCKRAAVERGYWRDPYVQHFIKIGDRKPPEINRGYFARVKGIKLLVDKFLEISGSEAQIVNLGAGFDTLFWRLQDERKLMSAFVDVDFPPVTMKKVHYIRIRKPLLERIVTGEDDDVRFSQYDLHSSRYHLVGVDMKDLQALSQKLFIDCHLDPLLPTLFITECVLVYIAAEDCDALLKFIASAFKKAVIINYDPVNMNDKFAEIMLENLRQRDCHFLGLEASQSLAGQEARLSRNGFNNVRSWLMLQVYQSLPADELKRIEALELMDEHELLQQLLNHYCISVANNCDANVGFNEIALHPVAAVSV